MTKTITIAIKKPEQHPIPKRSKIQLKVNENGSLRVSGLPNKDIIAHVAKSSDDVFYVVHRPQRGDYTDFRLHIGKESQLVETTVLKVDMYRDGGTTIIHYTLTELPGRLNFPTPFNKEAKPTDTYNEKTIELEKLV